MVAKSSPFITIFRGLPDAGRYTWSPFVCKLEARLRFANIPYRTEQGSIPKAPRGKVPYVSFQDGDHSPQVLPDSTLITKALIENGYTEDLNQRLSPTEQLHDLALKALLEDKLYFYQVVQLLSSLPYRLKKQRKRSNLRLASTQVYERWVLNYYTMRSKILGALPWPVQVLVGNIVYRKVTRNLQGQGTMTFTEQELNASRQEIWECVNGLVAAAHAQHAGRNGLFWVWGGEGPTEADAVLFGFIVAGLVCDA